MWYTFHWLGQIHVTRLLTHTEKVQAITELATPPHQHSHPAEFLGYGGLLFPLHPRVHFTGCPSLWTPKEKEKKANGSGEKNRRWLSGVYREHSPLLPCWDTPFVLTQMLLMSQSKSPFMSLQKPPSPSLEIFLKSVIEKKRGLLRLRWVQSSSCRLTHHPHVMLTLQAGPGLSICVHGYMCIQCH